MRLYYYVGSERKGPIASVQLRALALKGEVTPETIVENEFGSRIDAANVRFVAPGVSLDKEFIAAGNLPAKDAPAVKRADAEITPAPIETPAETPVVEPEPSAKVSLEELCAEPAPAQVRYDAPVDAALALDSTSIDLSTNAQPAPAPRPSYAAPKSTPIRPASCDAPKTPSSAFGSVASAASTPTPTPSSAPQPQEEKSFAEVDRELELALKSQVAKQASQAGTSWASARPETVNYVPNADVLQQPANVYGEEPNAAPQTLENPSVELKVNPNDPKKSGGCGCGWIWFLIAILWAIWMIL